MSCVILKSETRSSQLRVKLMLHMWNSRGRWWDVGGWGDWGGIKRLPSRLWQGTWDGSIIFCKCISLGWKMDRGLPKGGGLCRTEQVALFNSTSSKQACRALHWVVNSIWNAAVTEYTSHIRRATPPRYPYTWLLYSKLLPLALLNADQVLQGLPLLWPFLLPS